MRATSSGRDELVATYLARPRGDPVRAAEAFATGQSLGTWLPVPGITSEMRARHGARVVELRRLEPGELVSGELVEAPGAGGDDARLVRVAFATENFGPQFPMLLTTLLGAEPSTSIGARLVDVELSSAYAAAFPGPGHGADGWRRLTGVAGRPLLLNMIKPCTGYPPEVGAGFVEAVARGGCDLVKDDEILADAAFNRVAERARAYRRRLERVAEETGHRARYLANVTTRPGRLLETAAAALEGGADALMVSGLAVGLDAVQTLAEARLGVPLFVHNAGVATFTAAPGAGLGRAVLLGRLLRLAGADAVLVNTSHGARPLARELVEATVDRLRGPWHDFAPVMPVVGDGLTAEHVAPLVGEFGADMILAVGGAIQGHPEGAVAGARAFRAAIDAAMMDR